MRIAVSGTHGSGKSTLIEEFLRRHPDYAHEPEPYDAGDGDASVDSFLAQLERSAEILGRHAPGARVIAERCPLDFLAYLHALRDLRRGGRPTDVLDSAAELAARGMEHVDLLVVLPLEAGLDVPEEEDPELREAMNERLLELVAGEPRAIEATGSPRQRLASLERALTSGVRQGRLPL